MNLSDMFVNNYIGEQLIGEYDVLLVLVSIVISVLSSLISLYIYEKNSLSKDGIGRFGWLLAAASAFGIGVWAMHFLGMLAFQLPVEERYSQLGTLLSVIPAIAAGLIALLLVKGGKKSIPRLVAAGLFMGAGIGLMHYSGMAAMQVNAMMYYDVSYFVKSIVAAVFLATAALSSGLFLNRYADGRWQRMSTFISALLLGCAVSAMHYIAMKATLFVPISEQLFTPLTGMPTDSLASKVIVMVGVILSFMVAASVIDKQITLNRKLKHEVKEKEQAEAELKKILENQELLIEERTKELRDEAVERVAAEKKLFESHRRTNAILNSAADGIVTINNRGVIESFNEAAEGMFGYQSDEVVGKNVSTLMPDRTAEVHDSYIERYLNDHQPNIIGMGRELSGKRKDGSIFPLELAVSELMLNHDPVFTGVIRDITERKENEQKLLATMKQLQETQGELVESEKMASLGGLVAGVAHEINTPIGVSLTAATHLEEKASGLEKLIESGQLKKSSLTAFLQTMQQSSDIITSNLNRASELIRSFKQVAVDQSSDESREFSLVEYVEEVMQSLHPKLKVTRHKVTVVGDRAVRLKSCPGAISQIITNLVMNSLTHAFEGDDQGAITISVDKPDEAHIHLFYEDDGKGIPEENLGQVFEPFFTTKRGEGGSGLGMHILYNLVTQKLGGSIQCKSKLGEGIRVDMVFPIEQVQE